MGRQKYIENLFYKYEDLNALGLFCSFSIISNFESDTDRSI